MPSIGASAKALTLLAFVKSACSLVALSCSRWRSCVNAFVLLSLVDMACRKAMFFWVVLMSHMSCWWVEKCAPTQNVAQRTAAIKRALMMPENALPSFDGSEL